MLMLHGINSNDNAILVLDLESATLPSYVHWIDIFEGTEKEIAFVERAIGRHVPKLEELKEIENSSRLHFEKSAFYLSAPLVARDASGMPLTTPVGIILTKMLLVTVRFANLTAFSVFSKNFNENDVAQAGSAGAFVGLMDALVDRSADVLEEVGSELDVVSRDVFARSGKAIAVTKPPQRETIDLRNIVYRIGRSGDLSSKIRDSLLGLSRITSYVAGTGGADWFTPEFRARLETQRHDIASLSDYDAHQSGKVQLLLDATMGLINIEQNNIIKVLTVVSVVGVPPTLVASMYGMNFRHMPELDWAWGYPYGLALIFFSAVAPLVWFKVRGWL